MSNRFNRINKPCTVGGGIGVISDPLLYQVVHKIFKFLPSWDKTRICQIIGADTRTCEGVGNAELLADKLSRIYQIVRPVVVGRGIQSDEDRQEFITGKLQDYLQTGSGARFLDIGGGNGNILSGLQTWLGGSAENYICVENKTGWQENYMYSNENIRYLFWDNLELAGVPDASVDIVFCMVSLHHMTDMTIGRALGEIKRVLVAGGRLLIKEHNATADNLRYIYWEHHLYHVLDMAMSAGAVSGSADGKNDSPEWTNYCESAVNNFKSAEVWQELITSTGFELVARSNRFLDGPFVPDSRNPSELYWDEYRG
jgi:ubiquinone/menaquinone biosynthesis C-methylase UbiE